MLQRSRLLALYPSSVQRWLGLAMATLVVVVISAVGMSNSAPAQTLNTTDFADLPHLNGVATVELVVNGETITLEIKGNEAPITAGNFVDLVNQGFYDGLSFHRVVRQPRPFVVQAGDPQSLNPSVPEQMLGTGGYTDPVTGQSRNIPLEILPRDAEGPLYNTTFEMAGLRSRPILSHKTGAVAMARAQDLNSASSQFYITLAAQPFLDGNYAVFGYVINGMDAVEEIEQGDRIESARVTAGLENLVHPDTPDAIDR